MRHAARTDRNQAEIVKALRAAGCSVQCLHAVGGGVPDLLVGLRARRVFASPTGDRYEVREPLAILLEVKDGTKPPSERQLTPDQVRWHREWRGPVAVVTTVDEALRAVRLIP